MRNKFVKNVLKVLAGNITTILSGIMISFVLPLIISVTDYGYYKTFTLYTSYIGCMALGIIDGINLKYAGTMYEKLERNVFRLYFRILCFIHFVCALIIVLGSVCWLSSNEKFIFIAIGLLIIPNNLSGYFQQVSQLSQRFTEYTIRNVVKSIGTVLILICMYILVKLKFQVSYVHYVIGFLIVNYFLLFWYMVTYRDIIFGNCAEFNTKKSDIMILIKTGFPLMISNLCSTLILTIDRQFASLLFEIEAYAQYAFAYNLLSLVTIAISAVSIVLFPKLKQESIENLKNNYDRYVCFIMVLISGMLVSFYPLCILIKHILPKYSESLLFFKIMFPSLIASSVITGIMHNYYKSLGENFLFFKKTIVVLLISILANIVAYYLTRSLYGFSIATMLVSLFWYIYMEQSIIKKINVKWKKNFCYLMIIVILFYISNYLTDNLIISGTIYIIEYIIVTSILFKNNIKDILFRIRSKQ